MPHIVAESGPHRLIRNKKFLLYQKWDQRNWRTTEKCPWADRQGLEYLVSFYNSFAPEQEEITVEQINSRKEPEQIDRTPAERALALREEACMWDMVQEAVDMERKPDRERMVVLVSGEYWATHRWEVNPANGYVTVQLRDGSILPVRMEQWCPEPYAQDFFGIERNDIHIDDPQL